MTNVAQADEARERFAAAAREHLTGEVVEGVRIEAVDAETWTRAHAELWGRANQRGATIDPSRLATEEEWRVGGALDAVVAPGLEHRVLLRAGEETVGAYWGQQETWGRYHMIFSVVHPAWQRRGIYRAMLARVIAAARASGFREIYSRHRADNNAVIIPKLKAGFLIAGFEITPRHGILVHLRYYLRDAERLAFEYRVDGSNAAQLRERGCDVP